MLSTYPSPITVSGVACSPVQASSDVQRRPHRTRSAKAMPSAVSSVTSGDGTAVGAAAETSQYGGGGGGDQSGSTTQKRPHFSAAAAAASSG
eukprot:993403-Prymnesium_polylepis.1